MMADRIEDILGGVEEEIRRAEERLQLDIFREKATEAGASSPAAPKSGQATGSAHGHSDLECLAPGGIPSVFFGEERIDGLREARLSSNELLAISRDSALSSSADGRRRRRAWIDLKNDGPSRINYGGSNGSDRCGSSIYQREAVVNRLLKERDARLRLTAGLPGEATDQRNDETSAVAFGRQEMRLNRNDHHCHHRHSRNRSVSARTSRRNGHIGVLDPPAAAEGDVSAGEEEDGSNLVSPRGNIFFASDIMDALPSPPPPPPPSPSPFPSSDNTNADSSAHPLPLCISCPPPMEKTSGGIVNILNLRDTVSAAGRDLSGKNMSSPEPENGATEESSPPCDPPPRGDRGGTVAPKTTSPPLIGVSKRGQVEPRGCEATAASKERYRAMKKKGGNSGTWGGVEKEAAAARLEERLLFRPKTADKKRSSFSQESGKNRRVASDRRIEELARNRQAVYSERERQRKEIQEEKETQECTFRPYLTATAAVLAAPAAILESSGVSFGEDGGKRVPLHERLHTEARERQAARGLAQHHLEQEALRECTFQPTLTAADNATYAGQRPLHERVWEVEREREHKLRLLQVDKEEREGATFAPPPMGRVSERLARVCEPWMRVGEEADGKSGGGGVAARLEGQVIWARKRRRQRLKEHEEAEARMSTFEPKISRGTESLVRRRPELQAPFEERQAMMDAKRRERDCVQRAERAKEEKRLFNPTTARRTDALLRRRIPQRFEETVKERVARMATVENRRRRNYVASQRAKEELECTFRPSLNPVTQSLGQAAPLDELVNNRRGQRIKERAQVKARKAQTCSHKPVLFAEEALLQAQPDAAPGPSARNSCSNRRIRGDQEITETRNGSALRPRKIAGQAAAALYGPGNKYRLGVREPWKMTTDLRVRERKQEERIRAIRQEQEVVEMQRCTFVPQTNTGILRAQGPVLVRGLGRHLELKDVAQQMEQDRRMREAQAFGVRPGALRRTVMGETVLEPFSLSESDSKGWWEARRKTHEAERAAEFTFKPWTVEAERSKALSNLLEWSSILSSSVDRGDSLE